MQVVSLEDGGERDQRQGKRLHPSKTPAMVNALENSKISGRDSVTYTWSQPVAPAQSVKSPWTARQQSWPRSRPMGLFSQGASTCPAGRQESIACQELWVGGSVTRRWAGPSSRLPSPAAPGENPCDHQVSDLQEESVCAELSHEMRQTRHGGSNHKGVEEPVPFIE
eukprot:308859-Hanusia_phi.AAC.4